MSQLHLASRLLHAGFVAAIALSAAACAAPTGPAGEETGETAEAYSRAEIVCDSTNLPRRLHVNIDREAVGQHRFEAYWIDSDDGAAGSLRFDMIFNGSSHLDGTTYTSANGFVLHDAGQNSSVVVPTLFSSNVITAKMACHHR